MKRKLLTAALLLVLVLAPAMAMDLSIEDAVSLAMKDNPQLYSAGIDLDVAQTKSDLAWNSLLPTVTGTMNISRSNKVSSMMKQLASIFEALHIPFSDTPSTTMLFGISA